MIKISVSDLKKAVEWIEKNSTDEFLTICIDLATLRINTEQLGEMVEIDIFDTEKTDNAMPKIRKTELLDHVIKKKEI